MSQKVKVVVTDYIEEDLNWEAEQMAERGIEFECHQLKFAPDEEVIAATRDADIVVVNMVPITAAIMDSWEKCRMVIRHGAGYDNVDVAACTERGILLEYMPDYCADEVAEQAIALIFACARKVTWSRQVLDDSVARQVVGRAGWRRENGPAPAATGEMDRRSHEPADGPRDREPHLAATFRSGTCPFAE